MPYFDVKSPRRGAKIRLDAPFFVIGRGERIPIFQDDPSISREHAAIVIRASGVRVRDLGSKNGVLLNGKPIGKYAEVDVKPGDSLHVGATTLILREGEPPARVKVPDHEQTVAAPLVEPRAGAAPPPPPPPVAEEVQDLSKLEQGPPPPPILDSDDTTGESEAELPESEEPKAPPTLE
jgi:pSer/pThr/pTyr-binding forkhead associated (FHA) protein